jgi:serine/threonine-protein kinase
MVTCPYCHASNSPEAQRCATCDRALFGVETIREGSLVGQGGRYEIQRFLGRGGWGMVYKAYDRKLEEVVALKVLRHSELPASSERDERRFVAEIRLARKVRHPNVCAIHEYGEDGPLRYIAMEFIDGKDLRLLLREKGRPTTGEAFQIVLGAAAGLVAVHQAGVVHRDLKPDNIMIDVHGVVRLMDFGIAKTIQADAVKITATQAIVGTPWYMSPEQTRGDTLDARSDVYSFGIVVFETFTGDVPFRSGDVVDVMLMHRNEPAPLSGRKAVGLPLPVVPILAKALAKDRAERYGSVADLRADLMRAAQNVSPEVQTLVSPPTADADGASAGTARSAVTAPLNQATRTAVGLTPEALEETRQLPARRPAPVWPWWMAAGSAVALAVALWPRSPGPAEPLRPGLRASLPTPRPIESAAQTEPSLQPKPRPTAPLAAPTPSTTRPTPLLSTPSPATTAPGSEPAAATPTPVPTPSPTPRIEPPPPSEPAAPAPREAFPLPAGVLPAGWQAPIAASDNPQPHYRREDVSRDLKGRKASVLMSIVVSETGTVADLTVHKGDEPFVMAAVDAVRRWRFTPATFQGEPRPVKILVNVVVEQQR